ncbi:MAG: hypothetical protein ACOX3E_08640 [Desulfomonilia bacterium]|jgi:hypothetical protein|uniref:Outer membrane protease n=1 Tax=anaerobic digester metagenome TaxID=1263854 RepID=A0A485M136_9ZZZZ|nr:hypothetical protein [Pseudomonadota bacterium]
MRSVRTGITTIGILLIHLSVLSAAEFDHRVLFEVVSLWGETTYEITPDIGISHLSWPMDMRLLGAGYALAYQDFIEVEFRVQASPWNESAHFMEDCDWINESRNPAWVPYDALDVYSWSFVDSKAFLLGSNMRIFPLSLPPASFGFVGGLHYQEADFKAYDARQIGYNSWRDYTGSVSGPVATYTVEYWFTHIGATFRVHADRRLYLALDTSYIPYARAEDEDNHLRRMRISRSEGTGFGRMFFLSLQYFFTDTWYASTTCSGLRIKTSGDQVQYWYGNDPATKNIDETGRGLAGIDAEIEQETFHVGLGLGCRF